LSEQLLTHVREKLCRKSLEKFARNISEWLARDLFKLAAAEKRPSSVAEIRDCGLYTWQEEEVLILSEHYE